MATVETEAKAGAPVTPVLTQAPTPATVKVKPKRKDSILDQLLALLSSVRFGVTMLMLLLICCIIGMVIMQQDVEGFREYYARLLPAQKIVYGTAQFFNIYQSWYFHLLLAITGLNIILASIDRFPTAWQYIRNPKLSASPNFIKAQMLVSEEEATQSPKPLSDSIKSSWAKMGFRTRATEENGRTTVFGQRSAWNRLGAYFVHVALLTIFTGGFMTARFHQGGSMDIAPGNSSTKLRTLEFQLDQPKMGTSDLPFTVECTDISQKLINPQGGLEATNTVDWLTSIKIKDPKRGKEVSALVHLNEPFDYAGYRFFQQAFNALGNARQITVSLVPASGGAAQQFTIPRNQEVDVPGVGRVSYNNFFPDFTVEGGKPDTASRDYNNPAAQIKIVAPDGTTKQAFAFNPVLADQMYSKSGADKDSADAKLLVNGNKIILDSFEKVATWHTLEVQFDPGRKPVYAGFLMLVVALCSVFFFSHQRIWAVIEKAGEGSKVYFGGNTNRNKAGFEPRFNSLVEAVLPKRGDKDE